MLLIHGSFLAVGLFLFAGLAVGVFHEYLQVASVIWVPVLIGLGFVIQRSLWQPICTAAKVIGCALIVFLALLVLMSIGFGGQPNVAASISAAGGVFIDFYGPLFWLPFIFGAAIGGIHGRHSKDAEQAGGCDGEKPRS